MGAIPDSMDGIFSGLREAALTLQQGGGIGYDFSTLRPKGALVKGVKAMNGHIKTETLVMNSATGTVAKLELKTPKG